MCGVSEYEVLGTLVAGQRQSQHSAQVNACGPERTCQRQVLPSSAPSLGELTLQAKQNLQAPWLAFTAFFTFAIMLSLLIFIFEGIRDAFDPRKTFS